MSSICLFLESYNLKLISIKKKLLPYHFCAFLEANFLCIFLHLRLRLLQLLVFWLFCCHETENCFMNFWQQVANNMKKTTFLCVFWHLPSESLIFTFLNRAHKILWGHFFKFSEVDLPLGIISNIPYFLPKYLHFSFRSRVYFALPTTSICNWLKFNLTKKWIKQEFKALKRSEKRSNTILALMAFKALKNCLEDFKQFGR